MEYCFRNVWVESEQIDEGSACVRYNTCATCKIVVRKSIQNCTVHLAGILSFNSGTECTAIFVLYKSAHCIKNTKRHTSVAVT